MGEIKRPEFANIMQNELLLGYAEYDPNEPVCIPFDVHKRITMVIQGDNNSGKSIEGKNIVYDQLHGRHGRKVLAIDPKGDTRTLGKKNPNPAFCKRLARFKIKPKSYDVKYITPEALEVLGALGSKYKLGMDNFNKLPKSIRYELVKKAWTKDEKAPAVERALLDVFLSDNPPQTIAEFEQAIDEMQKPPPNLEIMLSIYKKTGVLGDIGANYPKLLAENGILSIETGLSDPEKDTLADIFVEDAVMNCVQDRTTSVTSENKEGYLHEPFTFFLEEADVFAGKLKNTSNLLTFLVTKYREIDPAKKSKGIETYGCDSIILSQHIHTLSSILVREADWILMPRLTDERDGEALRARGLDTVDLYDLSRLEFGRGHPKQWVAISKDGEIIPFRPLPTASWM